MRRKSGEGTLDFPSRPYLPPLFFAAVCACVLCALLLSAGWNRFCSERYCGLSASAALLCIFFGAFLVILGTVFKRRDNRIGPYLLACGIACFAAFASCSAWLRAAQGRIDSLGGPVSSYSFVVKSDCSRGERGISFTAEAIDGSGNSAAHVRLTGTTTYQRGDVLRVVGRWNRLDESDWSRSRFMKGESASVSISLVAEVRDSAAATPIERLRRVIIGGIDPELSPSRALLAGILCGYGTDLGQDGLRDTFARDGLSHLVAVSGSHLSIVCVLVSATLERTSLNRRERHSFTFALLAGYVLLTGASASAVRAAVMSGCGLLATAGGRRGHGVSALSLSVCGMLAFDPAYVFQLSFQLSVASLLGILLLGRYVRFVTSLLSIPGPVCDGLAMTIVTQLATAPISIPLFGQVSLVAPVSNLLIAPMVSLLLALGIVILPFGLLFAAAFFPLDALGRGIIFCARLCSSVPFASLPVSIDSCVPTLLVVVALVIYAVWPRPTKRFVGGLCGLLLSCVVGWVIFWTQFAPTSATVLEVGQADAILLRSGSHAVLVDAGVDKEILQALARNNVFGLDAVIVTHWDADHWGGLPYVLDTYPVGQVIVAKGAAENEPGELRQRGACLTELEHGDVINVGDISCTMLWPREDVDGEENADSLALLAHCGRDDAAFSLLLTGDTEVEEEREYATYAGDIDVLKLGHHGSAKSVDESLLASLKPELAVASAGEGNSYGHPTSECIQTVTSCGTRFLCTIDSGDIALFPEKSGVRVRCSKTTLGALE